MLISIIQAKIIGLLAIFIILLNKYNAILFCSVVSISVNLAIANITSLYLLKFMRQRDRLVASKESDT